MDSRHAVPSTRRRGPWGARPGTLAALGLLLVAGLLIQACSDNEGTVGPSFECREEKGGPRVLAQCTASPAPTTGFANTSANILIRVSANPASTEPGRRVTITVFVTNAAGVLGGSGQPLAGKRVFVNTSTSTAAFGTVDSPSGVTDANGLYTTTMIVRCSDAGIVTPPPSGGLTVSTVTVDAFVDGASSAATGTSATVSVTGTGGSPPCPGAA
jgi:hypothetical protein